MSLMGRTLPLNLGPVNGQSRRNPVAPMPGGEGQLSHPMQSSGWTAGTSVRFCTNRAMTPFSEREYLLSEAAARGARRPPVCLAQTFIDHLAQQIVAGPGQ